MQSTALEERCRNIFAYSFTKCWPVIKILLLTDSAVNFRKAVTKYPTTPQMQHSTALWNVHVRKLATLWNITVMNDK